MRSSVSHRVWPLLCIVVALFVLSVRAPRAWRGVAISSTAQLMESMAAAQEGSYSPYFESASEPLPLVSGAMEADELRIEPGDLDIEFGARSLTVERNSGRDSSTTADRIDRLQPSKRGDNRNSGHALADPNQHTNPLDAFATMPLRAQIGPAVTRQYRVSDSADETAHEHAAIENANRDSGIAMSHITDQIEFEDDDHSFESVTRQVTALPYEPVHRWPSATMLKSQLRSLGQYAEFNSWSHEVTETLDQLANLNGLATEEVGKALERLQQLAVQGEQRTAGTVHTELRNEAGRTLHALTRRLKIWQRIHDVAVAQSMPVSLSIRDTSPIRQVIDEVEAQLQEGPHTSAWRDYLCLDELLQLASPESSLSSTEQRALAQKILHRMDYTQLGPTQRKFMQQPHFLALGQELKYFAADPIDYFRLMAEVEEFESQRTPKNAIYVAAAQQALRWSHEEPLVRLGQELDGHYRNANIRIAISQDLVNRLMPREDTQAQPVDETIMGVRSQGCAETRTRLSVEFVPSLHSWLMRLVANGQVASQTRASQGPATFYTQGQSRFLAEKQLAVNADGIRQQTADVVADSDTNLTGLRTDLDSLPILGDIVQVIAQRQYHSRAGMAENEAENRLALQVGATIDGQVREQIEKAQGEFVEHFQKPMQKLGLNPVPLEMRTTEQRIIARYRLAGYHQLAANTPRPLAPSDSLLSMQIHDSAANNLIQQLGWDGKEVAVEDLYRQLTALFAIPEVEAPEDLPNDVTVRFAQQNAVRVTFQDGRVTFTLGFSELAQGRRRWKNFVIRVHYIPAPEQPNVDLVRENYVEVIGRLSLRDQIALRGVFSRVFHRDQPIDVISQRLADDARLNDLTLTELEIGDGWLGLAIGPRRVARR